MLNFNLILFGKTFWRVRNVMKNVSKFYTTASRPSSTIVINSLSMFSRFPRGGAGINFTNKSLPKNEH